jgi:hypothetical protein
MSRLLLMLALVNWIGALTMVPLHGLANGALKLRVMSYYNQLRVHGAINEEQLAKVGWEKLPGNELQKAHQYFLGNATNFYTATAWCASALLAVNGVALLLAYRTLRRSSWLTESAATPVSRQTV